mmetsp:Transcript_12112/g.24733  ORF Transcript_12112/g.24733 Transcript_12112/m.24733 type:complete len:89 (+) Transcript_12112:4636-4902(+)
MNAGWSVFNATNLYKSKRVCCKMRLSGFREQRLLPCNFSFWNDVDISLGQDRLMIIGEAFSVFLCGLQTYLNVSTPRHEGPFLQLVPD